MTKKSSESKSEVPVEPISKKHFQSSNKYTKDEKWENTLALGFLALFILVIVGLSTHWFGLSKGNTTLEEQFPPSQIILRSEASIGSKKAPIIIVELSDFECPYCGLFENQVFPLIKKDYIDTGEVLWFFMNLPLKQIHPHSYKAAVASECAKLQNKFWEYHDILFEHQQNLTVSDLENYAGGLSLDMPLFSQCLKNNETDFIIQEAYKQAHSAGITATPSFIIGKPGMGYSVTGFKVIGVETYATFQKLIEATKHKRQDE
ncbi:MAG TPA: thioredoxin domain-containing protein [Candidatus Nanoarchaeia archaeon]|nr:thioredoxin domain-containing protein [Candidatus Nanoarchaeia archaeon]